MIVTETARLTLRSLAAEDAEALAAVFCDPEVMKHSDGLQSPGWVRSWIDRMIEECYPLWGFGIWAIAKKPDNAVIGYCGLSRDPDRCQRNESEIGCRLARVHWGQGYGCEAASAARDYGLNTLGLPRLIAIIDPHNLASVHVVQKIGFSFEREISFPHYDYPDHLYALEQGSI